MQDILLQVDATVIAGILILLTVGSSFVGNPMDQKIIRRFGKYKVEFTPASSVALIVIPFATSAILIVLEYALNYYSIDIGFDVERYPLPAMYFFATIAGFVYLLWLVITLASEDD